MYIKFIFSIYSFRLINISSRLNEMFIFVQTTTLISFMVIKQDFLLKVDATCVSTVLRWFASYLKGQKAMSPCKESTQWQSNITISVP